MPETQLLEQLTQNFVFSDKVDIRWRDLDTFNHVNNAVYLTYFEQARIKYLHYGLQWDWQQHGLILAHASIDYRTPILLEDEATIYLRCNQIGSKSFTLEYLIALPKRPIPTLAATGKTVMVMFNYATQTTFEVPEQVKNIIKNYEKNNLL